MKDYPHQPTKATMFAYFDHRVTPLERQTVELWLSTPEGANQYFTYLDEWEREHPQFQPDMEQAHERFTQFMLQTSPGNTTPKSFQTEPAIIRPLPVPSNQKVSWLQLPWWQALAASLLLIGGLWVTADYWFYKTLTTGNNQIQHVQLPDESGVVLGANSSLRYARYNFGWSDRRVWLTGQAEFRVTHQSNHSRFQVHTPDQTVIEVLGTVFLVNSRRNTTRVTLETGRIRMTTPRLVKPLLLAPGDVVTISEQGKARHERPFITNTRENKQGHQFIFEDTPLTEVISQLQDVFGVRVSVAQPNLMSRTVTGTFQAETADDLLQGLGLIMSLKIDQTTTGYTLSQ